MGASKPPRKTRSASSDTGIEEIGRATVRLRQLLKDLGHMRQLEQSAATMPDARERLAFIDRAMHEASEKSISAVEGALPLTGSNREACAELSQRLSDVRFSEHGELVGDVISRLGEIASAEEEIHRNLMRIMEAQEFRDVAGQVVGKVVAAAEEIENILLGILEEYAPDAKDSLIRSEGLTAGPGIRPAKGSVTGQDEVDDLLTSLGL